MKDTVCPRSSYKVYVTTSWTYGSLVPCVQEVVTPFYIPT